MATTTTPNQYAEFIQQSRDAVRAAADSWTDSLQSVAGKFPTLQPGADVKAAVDQAFDFAAKFIEIQREFTANVIATGIAAGETVTDHVADVAGKATTANRRSAKAARS